MFIDDAVWWDIDVSLSEQETSAMSIMFMDATVGWVLDVSLSVQQTCATHIFLGFLFLCPQVLSCTQFFPAP
jgi:hypothetical protein